MDDKTIKETVKEERGKLRELPFKKKIGYIWDYYKPLMAGIIGVIVVISIIVQTVKGGRIVTELSVAFVNCYVVQEDEGGLHDDFVEYSGLNGKNQEVSFDTTYTLDLAGTDQMTMANQMKIAAVIGAKSLDIMIMPEDIYENYLSMSAYADLEEILGEEFLEEYSDILRIDRQEEDTEDHVYGLRLTGNEKLKEFYGTDTVILTVIANTDNRNNAEKFVQYVLS